MRSHQQNNKVLAEFISLLQEELKLQIKFAKQKVTMIDLANITKDFLFNKKNKNDSGNKENINTSNLQDSGSKQLNMEVCYLKKQMRIQQELTKKFIIQLTKERNQNQNHHGFSITQASQIAQQYSPMQVNSSDMKKSVNSSQFQTQDVTQSQPLSNMISSFEVKSSRYQNTRSIMRKSREESRCDSQRQKSKTFARLRKVEALFCNDNQRVKERKRKSSYAADSWNFQPQSQNQMIVEENKNLKAIHDNLSTHLSLMQKFKSTSSIEQLVQKEEHLRKKEMQLNQREEMLINKQIRVNKTHSQVLKKQKSVKIL